jgi:hypothetical protein
MLGTSITFTNSFLNVVIPREQIVNYNRTKLPTISIETNYVGRRHIKFNPVIRYTWELEVILTGQERLDLYSAFSSNLQNTSVKGGLFSQMLELNDNYKFACETSPNSPNTPLIPKTFKVFATSYDHIPMSIGPDFDLVKISLSEHNF